MPDRDMQDIACLAAQVIVIELEIPSRQQILLQSILQGEEGIGVIRSFDRHTGRQQLWTTPAQKQEAYDWLASLNPEIECTVTAEWLWEGY
ncbi:MAG: DUF4911 domain-containing protein [Mariprofundus sp.]